MIRAILLAAGQSKRLKGENKLIRKFKNKPLIRGGKYQTCNGEDFIRTVVWEFPSYEKAIECHDSAEYQAGWGLAKDTTIRHMQVIEGFSTE